ncbi:hypothetical protein [Flagellimonas meishanensis]|uniref:hypothetical protein n=1 Tax=Flagellimonas meishanensis TaxID=2873264 RepID=UPI001CA698D7|nr:hypothetical protein [[Muricauda] meishanensis]
MKNYLFTFLILQSIYSLAQNEKLILTESANNLWFESLNSIETLEGKIKLINERLTNDVNVYVEWSFSDGIAVSRFPKLDSIRKIRSKGFCKPLYLVKYKDDVIAFRIENPINSELTDSVTELIPENNIRNVIIWTDDKRQALYGTSADCGVIMLELKKKKVFKAFKKLNLPNRKYDEISNYK